MFYFFLFFDCIVLYCIVLHFLFWQWGLTHTMYTQGSGEEPQGVAGRAAGEVFVCVCDMYRQQGVSGRAVGAVVSRN